MAVHIVDLFEMIDIDHGDAEGAAKALEALGLGFGHLHEGAAIVKICQGIAPRLVFKLGQDFVFVADVADDGDEKVAVALVDLDDRRTHREFGPVAPQAPNIAAGTHPFRALLAIAKAAKQTDMVQPRAFGQERRQALTEQLPMLVTKHVFAVWGDEADELVGSDNDKGVFGAIDHGGEAFRRGTVV